MQWTSCWFPCFAGARMASDGWASLLASNALVDTREFRAKFYQGVPYTPASKSETKDSGSQMPSMASSWSVSNLISLNRFCKIATLFKAAYIKINLDLPVGVWGRKNVSPTRAPRPLLGTWIYDLKVKEGQEFNTWDGFDLLPTVSLTSAF